MSQEIQYEIWITVINRFKKLYPEAKVLLVEQDLDPEVQRRKYDETIKHASKLKTQTIVNSSFLISDEYQEFIRFPIWDVEFRITKNGRLLTTGAKAPQLAKKLGFHEKTSK